MDHHKKSIVNLTLLYKLRFPNNANNGVSMAIAPYLQINSGKKNPWIDGESCAIGIRGILDKKINDHLLLTANIGYAYQSKKEVLNTLDPIKVNNSLLFGTGLTYNFPGTQSYIATGIYERSEKLFDSERTPVELLLTY
jgi:hypothetical protein